MNLTIENSSLPDRLTERSFRQYESYIANAVIAYPIPYIFPDSSLPRRSTTFVARLRDAFTSLKRYRWSTFVDMVKFDKHYKEIKCVRHDHLRNCIIIGAIQHCPDIAPAIDLPLNASMITITLKSTDQKKLIAELASYKLLTQTVKVTGLTPDDIISLEENYDVAITQNIDQTWSIK